MKKRRKLTPTEIRNKEFGKKLFGYDPDQVDSFLVEVAGVMEEMQREIERLRVRTPEYKKEQLLEEIKAKAQKIVEQKKAEVARYKQMKEELELEIEKLRLARNQMIERLKYTIIDMSKILEGLRKDAKADQKRQLHSDRSKGSTPLFKQQDSGSGSWQAEGEGERAAGEGESEPSATGAAGENPKASEEKR
jgi:cell division initiation protein